MSATSLTYFQADPLRGISGRGHHGSAQRGNRLREEQREEQTFYRSVSPGYWLIREDGSREFHPYSTEEVQRIREGRPVKLTRPR